MPTPGAGTPGGLLLGQTAAGTSVGTITGTITGPGGAPLSGVIVTATSVAYAKFTATSGVDGAYTITNVATGTYTVQFQPAAGANYVAEYWQDKPYPATATRVDVTADTTTSGIDAELAAGASIGGTVTGLAGVALAGVAVEASGQTPRSGFATTETAADGSYEIVGLPAGSYIMKFTPQHVTNYASEYWNDAARRATATMVTVATGGAEPAIDAQLAVGGTITGKVTGPDNAALAGVWVTSSGDGSDFGFASAYTGADGTYSLTALVADAYVVEFRPPASTTLISEYWDNANTPASSTRVIVTPGATSAGVSAQLAVGGKIRGTVTGVGGVALSGVNVSVRPVTSGSASDSAYAHTFLDGTYVVTGLPAGSYVVTFGAASQYISEYWSDARTAATATQVSVTAGGDVSGIDAQLAVGGKITGTVTRPDGAPLASTFVTVKLAGNADGSDPVHNVSTAADGTYTIDGLATGRYTVSFSPLRGAYLPEYWHNAITEQASTAVSVTAGGITAAVDAQLEPAATVSGKVTNAVGDPVSTSVHTFDASGEQTAGEFSAGDGTYTLDGLRAGPTTVAFARASATTPYVAQYYSGSATAAGAQAIPLSEGAAVTGIDCVLQTGASIVGRVTNADGSGLAGRQIVAFNDADPNLASRGAITGADGSYTIEGLLPGTYRVAVPYTANSGRDDTFYGTGMIRPVQPNVTVTGTATTSAIDIALGAATATPFTDVTPASTFYTDIQWLRSTGISTGTVAPDGSARFSPTGAVSREAMAAFLYRLAGSPDFAAPLVSPFVDVDTSSRFYTEISWLAAQGISTGTDLGGGLKAFKPGVAVSREAMAAFLYRFEGSPAFTAPAVSAFVDVDPSSRFYREVSWLAANGISTGTDLGGGFWSFRPGASVSRQAMAAFLHRTNSLV